MEPAPRFLCDVMLARLARYLRATGLDTTLAVESATDAEIQHGLKKYSCLPIYGGYN